MRVYLVTMGCPKNLVDSEAAVTLLRRSGCTTVDDPARADLLVVNACSFLDSSWRETVGEVERLAAFKGAGKRLVLMGCLPRHRGEDLEATLPDVDTFLPTGGHGKLPELIESWRAGVPMRRCIDVEGLDRFTGFEGRDLLTPPHSAYVKVAEGCNRACSFCAIPVIRGRAQARSVDAVTREVESLLERGVKEVSLLAQDVVAYSDAGKKLPDLVASVAATGVEWVRIYYFHPAGIDVEYLARLFDHPGVVPYLEMPVQHGASSVLRRMRRSHDRPHLERLLGDIRRALPELVIRSEVIVGFPGENEREFGELKELIAQFQFDSLGIFPYSREPGTEAGDMDGHLPPELIRARHEELSSLQEALSFGARARFLGTRQRVLIDREVEDPREGGADGCRLAGRFYGQAPEVDGEVFVAVDETTQGRVGEFVDVEIVDAGAYDLVGRVL
jgi:ribosomal protein S12 methylthiotransferase